MRRRSQPINAIDRCAINRQVSRGGRGWRHRGWPAELLRSVVAALSETRAVHLEGGGVGAGGARMIGNDPFETWKHRFGRPEKG
eukprot:3047821-Pleurochrysis_carterae.AAC.1